MHFLQNTISQKFLAQLRRQWAPKDFIYWQKIHNHVLNFRGGPGHCVKAHPQISQYTLGQIGKYSVITIKCSKLHLTLQKLLGNRYCIELLGFDNENSFLFSFCHFLKYQSCTNQVFLKIFMNLCTTQIYVFIFKTCQSKLKQDFTNSLSE